MKKIIIPHGSRIQAWILIILLALSVAFWFWSVTFLDARMKAREMQQKRAVNTMVPKTEPVSDEKLNAEINVVTQSNIDTEMNAIDAEFK